MSEVFQRWDAYLPPTTTPTRNRMSWIIVAGALDRNASINSGYAECC